MVVSALLIYPHHHTIPCPTPTVQIKGPASLFPKKAGFRPEDVPALFWDDMPDDENNADLAVINALIEESTPSVLLHLPPLRSYSYVRM